MQISSWQNELKNSVRDLSVLLQALDLPGGEIATAKNGLQSFPLHVPRGFIERMRKNDAADPLLRQVLPLTAEDHDHSGFTHDPAGELAKQAVPGVLHKYHGRALLITTGACAIHCRYCFRRHFPYADNNAAQHNWRAAMDYLGKDTSITEIILSGGDPLMLTDNKLAHLVKLAAAIPHLKRLRIHSRMPVVLPSRIGDDLLTGLTATRLQPVMVIHSNHPNEIDNTVKNALSRLQQAQITVLNQSVLLKDVNNYAGVLVELNERLFDSGVLPYYLHLLDPVAGAAHFDVPVATAREIMTDLRTRLPGYLVPRLVKETAGAPYKIPVL